VESNDVRVPGGRRLRASRYRFGLPSTVPGVLAGLVATGLLATSASAGATAIPARGVARPAASVIQDVLTSVTCRGAGACVAVGYSGTPHSQRALIEVWGGKTWRVVEPPLPKNTFSSSLDGVSCPTTASCTAVGDALNIKTGFIEPLIVTGTGTAWTDVANPGLSAGSGAMLDSVSCATAGSCLAVGENLTGSGLGRAEQWTGTKWVTLAPPGPSNATEIGLDDVSCSGADSCTVVGFYGLGGDQLTLAESWNGSRWKIAQTPGGSQAAFRSVSCTSATACVAVGESATATSAQAAFAASWNGKTWVATGAVAPAGRVSPELDGVSCTSAKACIAVGFTTENTIINPTDAPLAEIWNGSKWALADPPGPAKRTEILSAVAATGQSQAMAVGNGGSVITGEQQTLAEQWSGNAWTTLQTPSP
jgi:hypothetical protein